MLQGPRNQRLDTRPCRPRTFASSQIREVKESSVLFNQTQVLSDDYSKSGSRFRFTLKAAVRKVVPGSAANNIILGDCIDPLALTCRQGGLDALNIFVVPFIEGDSNSTVIAVSLSYFETGADYIDGIFILP